MIKIYDISEWILVAEDLGYVCFQASNGWVAYDKDNHSICGHFDDVMNRGYVIKW